MPNLRRSQLIILPAAAILVACAQPAVPPASPGISVTGSLAPQAAPTSKPTDPPASEPGPTASVGATPSPAATGLTAPTEKPRELPTAPAAADGLTGDQRALLAKHAPQGAAPELQNKVWLNSEPLRLADLRGKVVLLDMWTFG
jgi:hypothetical protein